MAKELEAMRIGLDMIGLSEFWFIEQRSAQDAPLVLQNSVVLLYSYIAFCI